MAETQTETEARRRRGIRGSAWRAGVAAGILGGIAMAVVMTFTMADVLENAIAAVVGLDGGIVGWFVQMSIAAVFGVVFAALMTEVPALERYLDNPSVVASLGAAYGVVLWVVVMALAIPAWLEVVGGAELAFPFLTAAGFVVYLTYGFVLGGTFPYLR
ncbi:histidine kinase [Halobacterium zhouii]|uniref:histidine kinase n=1 Tax=Halobacterium zhouii TaxID=2902624 RepID=UPI001E45116B|nr:histidine kinase [Halobacterium zhouii]